MSFEDAADFILSYLPALEVPFNAVILSKLLGFVKRYLGGRSLNLRMNLMNLGFEWMVLIAPVS